MTTPRTVVDDVLPVTRVVVTGDLNTERVVVEVDDQPRIAVSNTGEDITVNVYTSAAGVNSVNGLQGDVTLTTTNIAEGTNLYYTNARVDTYAKSGELDYIVFDTSPDTTPTAISSMSWNDGDGTVDIIVKNGVTLQVGQEQHIYAKNGNGTQINNGQVVRVMGASGNRIEVALASNNSELTSSTTIAIATQDVGANQPGYFTTSGLVRDLNTAGLTEGGAIYLGTSGNFTQTKPTQPNHIVPLGWVVRAHATVGSIFVHVANGQELNELHDALITNPLSGQFLRRNADNTLWVNESIDTDDVPEGATNQYFTTARARDAISAGNNITITNGVISTVTEPDFTTVTVTEAPTSGLYVTNKTYVDGAISSAIGAIDYPVDSVNSKTGAVVLSTTDIGEGTNLYHTTARARSAISATGSLTYNSTTGVIDYTTPTTIASLSNHDTDDLAEGTTNKYYTDARADARVAIGIANLVDSAPATLDTLNELAAALGDDPNFATTITTALGTKLNTSDFTATADSWLATKSTSNLSEGTNLYYTTARANSDFDTRLATKSTSDLAEGTNLYYTDGRFDTRFATKTTDNLSEGSTNLYYTDARADARIAAASIDALSDVVITSGTTGQMFYYNGTAWVNSATVDSANLNRFTRTNTGTGNNAILAVNRNRTDAARATDGGPWLGFEYTGTDNTQATSPQSAIRSMYDSAGNHKLQVLQLPGTYATPSVVAQFQRGNHTLISTTGYNIFAATDTTASTRANTHTLSNSANTTTYATIGASGMTLGNVDGVVNFVRTSGATVGARPVAFLKNTVSATTTPATNDGASFRFQAQGSNGTAYHLAQFSGIYSSTGDTAFGVDIANGDQNGATMTVVRPMTVKLSETRISATASPTATPGGNTLSDVAVFSATKVEARVPVQYPSYTTTQRDALSPDPGWVLWNSTDTKLQVYTGSAWVDLH